MRLLTPLFRFSCWLHSPEPCYLLAVLFTSVGVVLFLSMLGAALAFDMVRLMLSTCVAMLCAGLSDLLLAEAKRRSA